MNHYIEKCHKCEQGIRFEPNQAGDIVQCPHCGQRTRLGKERAIDRITDLIKAGRKAITSVEIAKPQVISPPRQSDIIDIPKRTQSTPVKVGISLGIILLALLLIDSMTGPPPRTPPPVRSTYQDRAALREMIAARQAKIAETRAAIDALRTVTIQTMSYSSTTKEVTGVLQNTSPFRLTGVTINFRFYTQNGIVTGDSLDIIQELQPGEKWLFEAYNPSDHAGQFKLVSVEANEGLVQMVTPRRR